MTAIDRRSYAAMFGPTVGDRMRLGDTELIIEVERDFTSYGEEVKFGGGKVIRDGMGQSQKSCSILPMFQGPGVQVVAFVPVAGPVPPPSMVVTPDMSASSICWGQIK